MAKRIQKNVAYSILESVRKNKDLGKYIKEDFVGYSTLGKLFKKYQQTFLATVDAAINRNVAKLPDMIKDKIGNGKIISLTFDEKDDGDFIINVTFEKNSVATEENAMVFEVTIENEDLKINCTTADTNFSKISDLGTLLRSYTGKEIPVCRFEDFIEIMNQLFSDIVYLHVRYLESIATAQTLASTYDVNMIKNFLDYLTDELDREIFSNPVYDSFVDVDVEYESNTISLTAYSPDKLDYLMFDYVYSPEKNKFEQISITTSKAVKVNKFKDIFTESLLNFIQALKEDLEELYDGVTIEDIEGEELEIKTEGNILYNLKGVDLETGIVCIEMNGTCYKYKIKDTAKTPEVVNKELIDIISKKPEDVMAYIQNTLDITSDNIVESAVKTEDKKDGEKAGDEKDDKEPDNDEDDKKMKKEDKDENDKIQKKIDDLEKEIEKLDKDDPKIKDKKDEIEKLKKDLKEVKKEEVTPETQNPTIAQTGDADSKKELGDEKGTIEVAKVPEVKTEEAKTDEEKEKEEKEKKEKEDKKESVKNKIKEELNAPTLDSTGDKDTDKASPDEKGKIEVAPEIKKESKYVKESGFELEKMIRSVYSNVDQQKIWEFLDSLGDDMNAEWTSLDISKAFKNWYNKNYGILESLNVKKEDSEYMGDDLLVSPATEDASAGATTPSDIGAFTHADMGTEKPMKVTNVKATEIKEDDEEIMYYSNDEDEAEGLIDELHPEVRQDMEDEANGLDPAYECKVEKVINYLVKKYNENNTDHVFTSDYVKDLKVTKEDVILQSDKGFKLIFNEKNKTLALLRDAKQFKESLVYIDSQDKEDFIDSDVKYLWYLNKDGHPSFRNKSVMSVNMESFKIELKDYLKLEGWDVGLNDICIVTGETFKKFTESKKEFETIVEDTTTGIKYLVSIAGDSVFVTEKK